MSAIKDSSDKVAKIIKTIDEIAFQSITSSTTMVKRLVDEVSIASRQQAQGIDQVSQAIARRTAA